jgi:hypothetical protein
MKSLMFAIAAIMAIGASSTAMAQSLAHESPAQVYQTQRALQAENAQAQARWSAIQTAPTGSVAKQEAGSARMTPAS